MFGKDLNRLRAEAGISPNTKTAFPLMVVVEINDVNAIQESITPENIEKLQARVDEVIRDAFKGVEKTSTRCMSMQEAEFLAMGIAMGVC